MFNVYFQLGLNHIANFSLFKNLREFAGSLALDHILFIVALCAVYQLKEWKKVLVLVTAFTIGHSITLALSALDIVSINSDIVEFLIPITILLTAIYNILFEEKKLKINSNSNINSINIKYLIALFFGMIHGMGFSNYFKSLLGQETNITLPLFAFNVGIEAAQIMVVAVILILAFLSMDILKLKQRYWNWIVSGIAIVFSFKFIYETWPF